MIKSEKIPFFKNIIDFDLSVTYQIIIMIFEQIEKQNLTYHISSLEISSNDFLNSPNMRNILLNSKPLFIEFLKDQKKKEKIFSVFLEEKILNFYILTDREIVFLKRSIQGALTW